MGAVKATVKDSLFTHMFGDESKEYLLKLYQALHPEDIETGIDNLEIISIENALSNDIYNDLGFIANDRLVVLVEAQSTWSVNSVVRLLLYLAKTYQTYIFSNKNLKARLYTESKINLPKAEMYVLYAGKRGDKPSEISLKDEVFGADGNVDLKANIIFADEERNDIIGEYLAFCTILKEQVLLYNGDKQKAIQSTISICIEQGKLVRYLSEHRREVEDYMFALMSDEEMKEAYGDYRESIGEARGEARGEAKGRKLEKVNTLLESIRNIMKSLDVSTERAMDILDIPAEERPMFLEKLNQE
jgi:hypothetical protein